MQDGLQLTSRSVTMSRDTKASCTDCQRHAEASAVPFASPIPVDAIRVELNEPERSVRPVSSFVATTCASDTDEGDYETSSEGMVLSRRSGTGIHGAQARESLCVYLEEKSASLSKRAAFDGNGSAIKREVISDPPHELMENRLTQGATYVRDGLGLTSENLAQSKSLPILKSEIPRGVSTDFTAAGVALTSASSSARRRKMSMIIKRMAPLISPYPSTVSLTTGATANFRGRRHETRRRASPRTMLPILCDAATVINDGRSEELVAEAILGETKNNAVNWGPRRDAIPTSVNDVGAAGVTNDDDLIDVARNPYSSIKSVYFPPDLPDSLASPYDLDNSKKHQRVSTDVETLLKIDQELGPLRYQYSEIIGKTRALGLGGTGFDLDICRLNRANTPVQSALSPSVSDDFLDRSRTYLRRATISSGIANRSAFADKTSPSSSFSVVGKPTPRGSRISWLNDENGSSRRQEAFSSIIRVPSRAIEHLDVPRSSGPIRNSASYLPTTNSHAFQGENILDDRSRNGCVSNSNFQPYRSSKAVIERATSTWDGWLAHRTASTSAANIFSRTEYNSHRYLNEAVENSRTSTNNSLEIRRRRSSVSIVEVIDNNWSTVDERTASKRSNGHSVIPPGNQNSMVVETEFASRGSNYHESILPETERVARDDRVASSLALKSIGPSVDPDRGILRAVSASACAPQIRVVRVNTEFHTIVEKRCTNRAVSPIQDPRSTTAWSTTTSPSNVLLAAKVSSIFVQQVRADSSREVAKIESAAKMRSIDAGKQDAIASAASKRDFCAQKVDSRSAAEYLWRLAEFKRDDADSTPTELRKLRHLRLPRARERITIVPIVFTDGISEPSRTADVDFAIPRYAIRTVPKPSYQIVSLDAKEFRGTTLPPSTDNAERRRDIGGPVCLTEEFAGEKRWRADRTSVSRVNRHPHAEEDYLPSTTTTTTTCLAGNPRRPIRITTSNAGVVRKAREYREFGRQGLAKAIPGMRSTPEDFLCET